MVTAVVPWTNYVYLRFTNVDQSSSSYEIIFLVVVFLDFPPTMVPVDIV